MFSDANFMELATELRNLVLDTGRIGPGLFPELEKGHDLCRIRNSSNTHTAFLDSNTAWITFYGKDDPAS